MKIKRIIALVLVLITALSLCSCATSKAQDIDILEGVIEMNVWHSKEPYRYHFCFTEDNRLFTVKYKIDKKESGTYTLNDVDFEYAKKASDVTLTEEQAQTVKGYLEALEYSCREKGEHFDGPNVELTCNGKTFHFTYGQCLDRDFDNLVSAIIEYSAIAVTDNSGNPVVPTQSSDQ